MIQLRKTLQRIWKSFGNMGRSEQKKRHSNIVSKKINSNDLFSLFFTFIFYHIAKPMLQQQ